MRFSRILAISSLLVAASFSMAQTLNVGDKAPALKVTNWVKGKPQTLGNGNITVVEFWATWCGPCKMSIPHLTELAHRYKDKVNFVGVSIWESKPEDYTKAVPAFVKDYGDKMDYNVATEGPETFMATNWMKAAGENGIPSAFLINGEGKIVWIGHPMDGLDVAIDKLMAGKLDVKTARAEREKAKAAEVAAMKLQSKMVSILNAVNDKKMDKANTEAESMLTSVIADSSSFDANTLNSIIWTFVENDLGFTPKVNKLCMALGEKMMAKDPNDAMNMDTFALSQWRAGEKAKALATQKKAISLAGSDKRVTEDTMKEMQERLKMYGG